MAAKLNLLHRKEFELTLSDGKIIKGQFGTWAIKRFCDKKKITFVQLSIMKPEDYSFEHIVEMILCAVEHTARKEKQAFSFTDLDVCGWIDDMEGGLGGADLINLFNHSGSEDALPSPPDSEKKTQESSPGMTLSETTVVQAEV
jgi:hypothetical protein